ncbi:MAG: hypothetical protein GY769_21110 [bacterium]|nr:hypothetical protein [bacterium]
MVRITILRPFSYTVACLLLFAPGLLATERTAGLQVGYGQDFGFMLNSTFSDFAKGFPWDARFGLGYTSLDPGDPLAARRIFINDGTNGTPTESGQAWDVRVDLLHDFKFFEKSETFYFVGLRYSDFTGDFRYVGGNEEFEVRSNQWGLGGGVESHHPLLNTEKVDLVITAMVDYYLESPLSGHDTTYDPDGADVNPRRNYTYGDADAAIRQPKLVPRVMIGVNRKFGK